MSVTVSATPFSLLFSAVQGVSAIVESIRDGLTARGDGSLHLDDEVVKRLFNREYDTQIMDKETLLKTVIEHGAVNIEEKGEDITCDCEEFTLIFTKNEADKPYKLRISYDTTRHPEEFVKDIASEYETNAQEVSYNKIKKRLEQRNMEIVEEEVYDDNTIVLTVNLE